MNGNAAVNFLLLYDRFHHRQWFANSTFMLCLSLLSFDGPLELALSLPVSSLPSSRRQPDRRPHYGRLPPDLGEGAKLGVWWSIERKYVLSFHDLVGNILWSTTGSMANIFTTGKPPASSIRSPPPTLGCWVVLGLQWTSSVGLQRGIGCSGQPRALRGWGCRGNCWFPRALSRLISFNRLSSCGWIYNLLSKPLAMLHLSFSCIGKCFSTMPVVVSVCSHCF